MPETIVVDRGLEVAAVAPEFVVLRVEFADRPALRTAVQHVLRALRRVLGDILLFLHTVLFIGVDIEVAAHRLIDLVFAHLSDLRLRVMIDNLSIDRALAALVSPPRDGQVTTGDAVCDESAARLFDEGRVTAGNVAGLPRVRDSGFRHQLDIDAPFQGLEHVVVNDIARILLIVDERAADEPEHVSDDRALHDVVAGDESEIGTHVAQDKAGVCPVRVVRDQQERLFDGFVNAAVEPEQFTEDRRQDGCQVLPDELDAPEVVGHLFHDQFAPSAAAFFAAATLAFSSSSRAWNATLPTSVFGSSERNSISLGSA